VNKENALRILDILDKRYKKKAVMLHYKNPLELLISTILSAQCTDAQVNKITQKLFRKYKSASDYANADQAELEEFIHSSGFYHSKAKHIIATGKILVENYDSKVPDRMEDLVRLSGVARKTANIVLSGAFGKNEGIAVDTHVFRLSRRLGLSKSRYQNGVERDLMVLFPKDRWFEVNTLLIRHGRAICTSRKAGCKECVLSKLCPSAFKV
jgi:endonuclease III